MASVKQAVPELFDKKKYCYTISACLGAPGGETMTLVGLAAKYDKPVLKCDVGSCLLRAYRPKWPEK
jgi:hypothetical protein